MLKMNANKPEWRKGISNGPTYFGHDLCPFASGANTKIGKGISNGALQTDQKRLFASAQTKNHLQRPDAK